MTNPNRVPAGSPEGGQYAPGSSAESSTVKLSVTSTPNPWEERLAELEGEGYVEACSAPSSESAEKISRRHFWRQAHVTAEYGHAKGDYPQMGEKETRQLATYSGNGVAVRMPSRQSVRAFAFNNNQSTIDVPVTVDHDGRSVTGWVRATPGKNGQWETQALGFSEAHADTVAESVNAVLESRRPRSALKDAGVLAERRAQRRARYRGIQLDQINHSSAFQSLGHDGTDVLAVRFHDYYRKRDDQWVSAKVYGYRVPPEVGDEIRHSASPGRAFAPVKKEASPVSLDRCTQCLRYYEAGATHVCRKAVEANRQKGRTNAEGRAQGRRSLAQRFRGR